MAWQEVQSLVNFWNPEENKVIEGIYRELRENIGINKSKLYLIETKEGIKKVWGSTVLDNQMSKVPFNSKIRIEYLGLGQAKGGRHAPKLFKVMIDPDYKEEPYEESDEENEENEEAEPNDFPY